MSVAAGINGRAPAGAFRLPAQRAADTTIALLVFLGGFVMVEPAPYDVVLVVAVGVWAILGLKLDRHVLPLAALLLVYAAGGFLSLTQVSDPFGRPFIYMLTDVFLVISAVFMAAVIAEQPERRLALIAKAYLASAAVVAVIGILAYFDVFPGADAFKLYDRAKGTFKDPNVFGPFLILPLAILGRDILTGGLGRSVWRIVLFFILLFAIFLSFSRAAWGMALVALLLVAVLTWVTDRSPRARFRLSAYLVGGTIAVTLMLAAAINVPAVRDLYDQRAFLVQEYDAGEAGRFERQQIGFFLIQERPLGLGPGEFGLRYGEDEHNTWLKAFTTYGWLGGFSYAILAIWTLAAATPLIFKPRPWQPLVQCTWAAFVAHLLAHNVIDTNHWRHLFLTYGMLWGAIAAEKLRQRQERRLAAAGPQRRAPGHRQIASIPRAESAAHVPAGAPEPAIPFAGTTAPQPLVSAVPRARPRSYQRSALQRG